MNVNFKIYYYQSKFNSQTTCKYIIFILDYYVFSSTYNHRLIYKQINNKTIELKIPKYLQHFAYLRFNK